MAELTELEQAAHRKEFIARLHNRLSHIKDADARKMELARIELMLQSRTDHSLTITDMDEFQVRCLVSSLHDVYGRKEDQSKKGKDRRKGNHKGNNKGPGTPPRRPPLVDHNNNWVGRAQVEEAMSASDHDAAASSAGVSRPAASITAKSITERERAEQEEHKLRMAPYFCKKKKPPGYYRDWWVE